MLTLRATTSLLDYSDEQLTQSLRFHRRFPESATDTRVHVCELILEARKFRRIGTFREIRLAQRYEAEVFEILFFTTDETHNSANGESLAA